MNIDDATLKKRLNRRLRRQRQQLHVARPETTDTGRRYTVENGRLVAGHGGPGALATHLGIDPTRRQQP